MAVSLTLPGIFFDQAKLYPSKPLFWKREATGWHALSWDETALEVRSLTQWLGKHGSLAGERIIIAAENRPEWAIAELAIMATGAIAVPTYTSYMPADYHYIITHSQACGAIISAQTIEKFLSADLPPLRFILMMDDLSAVPLCKYHVSRWPMPDAASPIPTMLQQLKADKTCCIIYTSGTSGNPKGVMLTHRSIIHNIQAVEVIIEKIPKSGKDQIFLSLLPLSHAYEHMAGLHLPIAMGAEIYYCPSSDNVGRDLGEVRPTLMTAVPRLYELLYARITTAIRAKGGISEKIFRLALDTGLKRLSGKNLALFPDILFGIAAHFLIKRKIKRRFGGRLSYFISGGAALSPDIGNFFSALGVGILQGYGQTEASPLISVNLPGKIRMDTVGPPIKGVSVKCADDGELLVKGDNIMQGYWRNQQASQETVQKGWLHTGDLAEITEEGFIKIIGRKKEIIVLSNGHTLSPARIEMALSMQNDITQAMVTGNNRPWLVALIVPNEDIPIKNQEKFVNKALEKVNQKLSSVEKIRRILILTEAFSIENQQMTPTLKLRRHKIIEAYRHQIDALYPAGKN